MRFDLDSKGEVFKKIESTLRSLGKRRFDFREQHINGVHYELGELVEWEPSDFVDVPYIQLNPSELGYGYKRDETGRLMMVRGKFKRSARILQSNDYAIVVPEPVMEKLARQKFVGLDFRPAVVIRDGLPAPTREEVIPWTDEFLEPYWELIADVELPPLSESVNLNGTDHESLKTRTMQEYRERGCHLAGSPWDALLRYRKKDLKKTGPFDFAKTYEPIGNIGQQKAGPDHYRRFIVSARFREFCLKQKNWKIDWTPVVVEK